jgi:hypothetical protein
MASAGRRFARYDPSLRKSDVYYTHQGMSNDELLAHIMNYVLTASRSRIHGQSCVERSCKDVTSPVAVQSKMMGYKNAIVSLKDASLLVC